MYDGTSALTFDPPVRAGLPIPAPAPAAPAVSEAPPAVSVPERSPGRAAANPAMKLSFRFVALFIGAMTVLLFIVYSYMELSQLSNAGQQAAIELQTLKREEGVLSRRVEASVSLSEVEAYAIGELGMVKPSRDQIVYISAAAKDHGEVIPQKGFWGSVRQLFSTMTARVAAFLD